MTEEPEMQSSNLLRELNQSMNTAARRTMWKVSLSLLFLALIVYVLRQPMQAIRSGATTGAALSPWAAKKSDTERDISQSSTCFLRPSGLISWWPGDGNARDIIGGRDGVLMNGAAFAPGMVGQAFSFNGSSFVSVSDDPIWTLGNNPFTIELWANFNVFPDRDPFIGHDEATRCSGKV